MDANKAYLVLGGSTTLALGVGVASGYYFAKKQLEKSYDERVDAEIAEAKEYYKALYKKEAYSSPEEVLNKKYNMPTTASEALSKYQGNKSAGISKVTTVQENDTVVETVEEVFVSKVHPDPPGFDYDEELKTRVIDEPYIVSVDEFMENEGSYEQRTVTYYEGDDVLVDDKDEIIDDVDKTVGEVNIRRFGHGSRDNNVVYVRNDKIELDFEVVRSRQKYTEVVLGFIEHSDSRNKIRRFRGDDE